MYIYLLFYFINIIFLFFQKNKITLGTFFLIINIFYAFNYLNGIDWIYYELVFKEVPIIFSNEYFYRISQIKVQGIEYLFILLISFFKIIPNLDYLLFQSILLTIDLFIIYNFVLKNSRYPILVMILSTRFLTAVTFEPVLRQLQSICIFYFSIKYITNKKFIKYFILNILGIMFHTSGLITIFIYFWGNLKLKLRNKMIILLSIFILLNFLDLILENIFKFTIFNHYKYYLISTNYGVKNININQIFKLVTVDLGIYLWLEINIRKINEIPKNFNIISNIYFASIIFKLLNLKLPIFYRFNNYTYIIYIIYVCFVFDVLKKYKKLLIGSLFLIYFGLSYILMIQENEIKDRGRYIPYSNYLFENKNNIFIEKVFERLKKSKIEKEVLNNIGTL